MLLLNAAVPKKLNQFNSVLENTEITFKIQTYFFFTATSLKEYYNY